MYHCIELIEWTQSLIYLDQSFPSIENFARASLFPCPFNSIVLICTQIHNHFLCATFCVEFLSKEIPPLRWFEPESALLSFFVLCVDHWASLTVHSNLISCFVLIAFRSPQSLRLSSPLWIPQLQICTDFFFFLCWSPQVIHSNLIVNKSLCSFVSILYRDSQQRIVNGCSLSFRSFKKQLEHFVWTCWNLCVEYLFEQYSTELRQADNFAGIR